VGTSRLAFKPKNQNRIRALRRRGAGETKSRMGRTAVRKTTKLTVSKWFSELTGEAEKYCVFLSASASLRENIGLMVLGT